MAQTKVTTAELKPTVINFKDTGTVGFSTTSSTYVDVTGSSVSYTSGPVAEKVFVIANVMFQQTGSSSGWVRLMGNGTAGTDEAYTDTVPTNWRTAHIAEWFDWPANTTGDIKLQARASGGTVNISKGGTSTTQSWTPSIKGFAISQ